MSTDALYIVVILVFFVVLGVGVYVVNRIMDPGREWPKVKESPRRAPVSRRVQRPASASPVEKRKPTPGSVRT